MHDPSIVLHGSASPRRRLSTLRCRHELCNGGNLQGEKRRQRGWLFGAENSRMGERHRSASPISSLNRAESTGRTWHQPSVGRVCHLMRHPTLGLINTKHHGQMPTAAAAGIGIAMAVLWVLWRCPSRLPDYRYHTSRGLSWRSRPIGSGEPGGERLTARLGEMGHGWHKRLMMINSSSNPTCTRRDQ